MDCQKYDLDVIQGAAWFQELEYEINGKPVNIESYSCRMKVRKSYDLPVVLDLSTGNAKISITETNKIQLELSATETASLIAGRYLYDIELINESDVERILYGMFTVHAEVTK
jgi:hypothetical protein